MSSVSTLPRDTLQERLADAIAVCWVKVHGLAEGLVYDSFEELLGALNMSPSASDLWDLVQKRFNASEYPIGVLNFVGMSASLIAQRYDSLYIFHSALLEPVEQAVRSLD